MKSVWRHVLRGVSFRVAAVLLNGSSVVLFYNTLSIEGMFVHHYPVSTVRGRREKSREVYGSRELERKESHK